VGRSGGLSGPCTFPRGGRGGRGFSAKSFDTGARRGPPVDEGSRSIRMLGCWCELNIDFTFRPTATTGFAVVEEEGGGCEEPG
jgi:hypothetical protein